MEFYYLKIPVPKRPWLWFRYRLTTILLLITIISLALAWRRDHTKLASELRKIKNPNRSYSTAQVVGPPNTRGPADAGTAWCPAMADNQQEWLLVEFEKSVVPTAIVIHETYSPGAVIKVTHVPMWGKEQVLWEGIDPTPAGSGAGVSRLPITTRVRTSRIKVYIDAQNVPGWNEIDAVGLEYGEPKKRQTMWTSEAEASSSYGSPNAISSMSGAMTFDTF